MTVMINKPGPLVYHDDFARMASIDENGFSFVCILYLCTSKFNLYRICVYVNF